MKHRIAIALTAALVLTGYRHDPQQIVPVEVPEPPVEILTNCFNFIRLPEGSYRMYFSGYTQRECGPDRDKQDPYYAESEDRFLYDFKCKKERTTVERIWDNDYSAFPSIVRYGEAYYVSFREGVSHIFDENGIAAGKTRILRSTDSKHWKSVSDGRTFSDPAPVVYENEDRPAWFWRVTWHDGTGYTVSYGDVEDNALELLKTSDGIHFEKVTTIALDGFPNESTVRFLPDGRLVMLIRRDKGDRKAYIGVSRPPYTEWDLTPLRFQIGGPEMAVLPDGSLLIGGRAYFERGETRTCLWRGNEKGDFELWKTLPSGGDNSYPGFLIEDGELKVVYYSSHELTRPDGRPRAGIYLARIPL